MTRLDRIMTIVLVLVLGLIIFMLIGKARADDEPHTAPIVSTGAQARVLEIKAAERHITAILVIQGFNTTIPK